MSSRQLLLLEPVVQGMWGFWECLQTNVRGLEVSSEGAFLRVQKFISLYRLGSTNFVDP